MAQYRQVIFGTLVAISCFFAAVGVNAAVPKPDMRVVIDISGSMKRTDPENLRVPASKLLLNLAKDQTQFGVWTFGKFVNMLVPHKPVDAAWRENALNQVELINSVALYTNIGEALEKASLNQTEPDPNWDRTIVLLSDGKVDISKNRQENEAEKQRILTEVIPRLKKAGFKIHSVALSKAADTEFLKKIAMETNGRYSLAKTANDLMALFVQASDQVNKPEQVPLEGNRFSIDKAVQEFTALIFRKPGSTATALYTPTNQKITVRKKPKNVFWFSDRRYDLITVKKPQPGEWRIKADMDPDNRVTVVTDLSMVMEGLPDNIIEGEKVTMKMYLAEKGAKVTNRDFLSILEITFSQDTSSGDRFAGSLSHHKSGKPKLPKDGVYSAKLGRTLTEGEHLFEVSVDGKTFQRKRSQRVTVHRDVISVDQGFTEENGEELKFLLVKPKAALIDPEEINLKAQLKGPAGEKAIQDAKINDEGVWQVDVPKFERAGVYEVLIKVAGVSASGRPFELIQGPYEVDYTPVGMEELATDLDELAAAFEEEDLEVPEIEAPKEVKEEATPELLIETVEEEPEAAIEPELEEEEASEAEGTNWPLLIVIASLGNIILIGGGWFLYRRTTRKEDAEREQVHEEITRMHKLRAEGTQTQPQTPPTPPAAQQEPPLLADVESVLDDDEATVITATPEAMDDATIAQPSPAVAPQEPIPEEENQAYTNQAAPLEIEEDEMIEVDDFDDFDEDTIGDLDDMLSEQEETVEAKPEEAKPEEAEEDDPMEALLSEETDEDGDTNVVEEATGETGEEPEDGFANDEFMLDDTEQK